MRPENKNAIDALFQRKPLSIWKILRLCGYARLFLTTLLICTNHGAPASPLARTLALLTTFGEFYIMKNYLHTKFGKFFIALEGGFAILVTLAVIVMLVWAFTQPPI
ncbi:MAG: hypothetical protein LBQ19_02360 [Synergistaceae bacterium]|nr:hypothetical protein [Synergistaceae bacterium]